MKGPVDVTQDNPETYNSSNLAMFAWAEDPQESEGLLFVRFQNGNEYVYYGADKSYFEELKSRAFDPTTHTTSVGEYFVRNVKDEFRRKGQDYDKFTDIIN